MAWTAIFVALLFLVLKLIRLLKVSREEELRGKYKLIFIGLKNNKLFKVSIYFNMVNRLMHFVYIVLHVVNNYKVKQSNKKQLVHEQIFQQLLLMLKAVCELNNDLIRYSLIAHTFSH
jgi:hypothetical protein